MKTQSIPQAHQRRLLGGALLCVLAVVFATAAKVAWYHPHRSAEQSIASMKAWNNQAASTLEASALVKLPGMASGALVPALLCVLVLFGMTRSTLFTPSRKRIPTLSPSRRRNFARPPPIR